MKTWGFSFGNCCSLLRFGPDNSCCARKGLSLTETAPLGPVRQVTAAESPNLMGSGNPWTNICTQDVSVYLETVWFVEEPVFINHSCWKNCPKAFLRIVTIILLHFIRLHQLRKQALSVFLDCFSCIFKLFINLMCCCS